MKKVVFILVLSIVVICLKAQTTTPTFSQLFFNPSLYNPSYVGASGQPELFLVHRRQWVGIEDAPVISGVDFQYPTAGPVSLGLSITSGNAILLRTNRFLANVVYNLKLGDRQNFRFGLSAGLGSNNFDVSEVAVLDDPALANINGSSSFLDGRFGVNYTYKGLNIGFSLPKIFKSKANSIDAFNKVDLDAFEEKIFSVSYKIDNPGAPLSFQPYLLYRTANDGSDQLEGTLIAYYEDNLWAGLGYRKGYGTTVSLGARLQERYSFSYAFEFNNLGNSVISNPTHEIQFNVKLGKMKSKTVLTDTDLVSAEEQYQELLRKEEEELRNKPEEEDTDIVDSRVKYQEEDDDYEQGVDEEQPNTEKTSENNKVQFDYVGNVIEEGEKDSDDTAGDLEVAVEEVNDAGVPYLKPGYYVVVGAFNELDNAKNFIASMKAKGYDDVDFGYRKHNGLYYLFSHSSENEGDARSKMYSIRNRKGFQFSMAWLLKVK